MTGHRVNRHVRDRAHPPMPAPLPKDAWVGRLFVEADGTIDEIVWTGTSKFQPSEISKCDTGSDIPGGGAQ